MEDPRLFSGYEQRKNIGKIMYERKYSASACKDVEKKLSCLSKKINDLENQRKNAYKNLFRVKKKIQNQTNQIVKCHHQRERNLLVDVDQAYVAQDASMNEELSKLISTQACCQTLYTNLHDVKDNVDVLLKINEYLSTINFAEKTVHKPIEFTSNFEQAKNDASCYGRLEGEFVGKNPPTEEDGSPVVEPNESKSNPCKHCCMNVLDCASEVLKDTPKLPRTNSQDSFEMVDLEENINNENDENFEMYEKDWNSKSAAEISPIKQEVASTSGASQARNSAKYSKFQKKLSELQIRLEGLSTSATKLNPNQPDLPYAENKKLIRKTLNFAKAGELNNKAEDTKGWLLNSAGVGVKGNLIKVHNNSSLKISASPAELLKQALASYFSSGNVQSWLSK